MLGIKVSDFVKTKYTWNSTSGEWVLTFGILGLPKGYHKHQAPGNNIHEYGESYEVATRDGIYTHQRYVFND